MVIDTIFTYVYSPIVLVLLLFFSIKGFRKKEDPWDTASREAYTELYGDKQFERDYRGRKV